MQELMDLTAKIQGYAFTLNRTVHNKDGISNWNSLSLGWCFDIIRFAEEAKAILNKPEDKI